MTEKLLGIVIAATLVVALVVLPAYEFIVLRRTKQISWPTALAAIIVFGLFWLGVVLGILRHFLSH